MIREAVIALCALLGCTLSHLTAQRTWKVDAAGSPGSHFTDIPPAVAAAAPGDTILVYTGVGPNPPMWTGFTAPTITKPLRLVGFHVSASPGSGGPSIAGLSGPLHVSGIGAGEQVVLSNFTLSHGVIPPPWGPGGAGAPVVVVDCDGMILFEDFTFSCDGTINQVVRFERADHVVLRGCEFRVGGAPMFVIDSNLLMSTSFIRYVAPSPFGTLFGAYTNTTETVFLQRSTCTVVGSEVNGFGPWGGQPYRSAFVMDNSTLRVGATSLVRGPQLVPGPAPNPWDHGLAYQFTGTGPNVVFADPRADIWNTGTVAPPTITPIDETFHDWVVADEWFGVRVAGPIGGFALLLFGDMSFPTPTPLGTLGVDPATAFVLDLVPLPAPDGIHSWNMFCPPSAPSGHAFCFQCATLSPTGALGLTEPSPMTVGWDKDRIP